MADSARAKETSSEPAKAAKPKSKNGGGGAPLFAILLLLAALIGGAVLRVPHLEAVPAPSAPVEARAAEAIEAAHSWSAGTGLTVADPTSAGGRRPTQVSPGEAFFVAVAERVHGPGVPDLVAVQSGFSIAALILFALAGAAGAGWWGAAGAAALVAFWPAQIEATRAPSIVPAATAVVALTAFITVRALRDGGSVAGLAAAGLVAGLAVAVHPLLILLCPGVLLAALIRPAMRPFGGALVGMLVGLAPVAIHRTVAFGSPLITAERAAKLHDAAAMKLFSETPGACLADWVGADAAAGSLNVDKNLLLQSPYASWGLALAAVAILGAATSVFAARSRAIYGVGAAALIGLALIPPAVHHPFGIPLSRATVAVAALAALLGGAGIAALARVPVLGAALAFAAALLPAALRGEELRKLALAPDRWIAVWSPLKEPAANAPAPTPVPANSDTPAPKNDPIPQPEPKPSKPSATQDPPVVKPEPPPPKHPVTAAQLAAARNLVDGEGGVTRPSVEKNGEMMMLKLRLESDRFRSSDAQIDAVRISMKFVRDIPGVDDFLVRVEGTDGKTLATSVVNVTKAKSFLPKLDDAFESRRMRDWWPQISERAR